MTSHDNVDRERLRQAANEFEASWQRLCEDRGESRYIEMFDRHRRCYARVFIPSEVMFVWYVDRWMAANEGDDFGDWQPVVSVSND